MRESLEQTVEQRLQQSLSPQQLMFTRTLEMPGAEFEEEVMKVLDENPALATDDSTAVTEADSSSSDDSPYYRMYANNRSASDPVYEPEAKNSTPTLAEALQNQLDEINLSDTDRALAIYIIGDIDSNGYLTRSSREISDDLAFNAGIDVTPSHVDEIIALIQSMDPPGVAAHDLRQSLELQLMRMDPAGNSVAEDALTILRDHYVLFTRKHFDRLAQAMNVSDERARDAVELLRSLNPKPGAAYDSTDARTRHIIPDFEVEPDETGHITLSMPNTIPALRVEESFDIDDITIEQRREQATRRSDIDALMFIRRKRNEAIDFIRAVTQRHDTLWRVMTAIMKLQSNFFASGDHDALRPMILKDVADLTGYDASVISRATAGKYVSTPYGIFPLKFFFNERRSEDTDTSVHSILNTLKQIVENEDHRKPMSDEALSAELKKRGYDVARRTVAKYREILGIGSARLRREL